MSKKIKPSCAYCGGTRYYPPGAERPKDYCKCKYRFMRMGASGMETETTSPLPASDMRKDIMKYMDHMKQDAPVIFKFSVTRIDEVKIQKAAEKRKVKKVADKLLGNK